MLDWHAEMAEYIKVIDAHHHLVNTSTGSFKTHPDLYGSTQMDFAEIHFYYVSGCCNYAPSDPAGRDMADLTRYYSHLVYGSVTDKPSIIGEWGLLDDRWLPSPYLALDDRGVHLHNGLWSALMSGMASTGLSWHWDNHRVNDPAWWQHYRALAAYFNNIPISRLTVMKPLNVDFSLPGGSDPRQAAFSSSNPHLRVMGLRSDGWVYAWVQNKDHTWWNYTHGIAVSPQSGIIAIHDLTPGEHYTVETWDTYTTTQQIISQENLTVRVDGSLQININNLQDDLAFKFRPEMTPRNMAAFDC